MALPQIGREEDGMFVPTEHWNPFFNSNRGHDHHHSMTAAHDIGSFVASQAIEHAAGDRYWDSADAFMDAVQPPMSDGERTGFTGAFTRMNSVRNKSQAFIAELQSQEA
jgi:hypothetical protein